MNLEEIQDLYEFNSWANKRILGAVEPLVSEQYHRDLGSSHGGVHGTIDGSARAHRFVTERRAVVQRWRCHRRGGGRTPCCLYAM